MSISQRVVLTRFAAVLSIAALAITMVSRPAHGAARPLPAIPADLALSRNWKLVDVKKCSSAGGKISTLGFPLANWIKATVPGTVLTSMVDDGIYPEPLYGENNRPNKISDSLCRTSYWYRAEFFIPQSYASRHIWLNFDGINYKAQVWLNGHELGQINGAFARGTFDISGLSLPRKKNVLAVKILPPPDPGNPVEQTIAAGVGPNGGILAQDGPTFLCAIGWDWIPGIRDRDMGIWQKVYLSASGPVTVRDTYVTSELPLPKLNYADLTVETTLTNRTSKSQSGRLVGSFDAAHKFSVPVTMAANETRTLLLGPSSAPQLHVLDPRLWWPNGYGAQNLYLLRLRFIQSKAVSDEQDLSFGIRQLTYSVPGSDNLTISVNGVPVLCKGGDWGMDEAMKREPYKRLDAQIRMHKLANFTMIRNWVGQSTGDDFYTLCDKYGIMLWDEFFQPNPSDGPNPVDDRLYLDNVREKVLRFRSHPCIAVWCGRNEGFPPPNIDAGIRAIMAKNERNRLYQPSSTSGRGVHSGGPYCWRPPAEFYIFDEPFKTEIGSVSVPTLESIEGMMPKKDWNTIDDDWAEHDLARGAQQGDRYPEELARRYGPISSLADFARKGQMANYEAFRAMYEGRNAKLFDPVTGVITWMSNPAQPSFVWQLYSWDLEPNSSLFATEKACEPIHIQMNQNDWHVMVINNSPETLYALKAKVSIYNLDGKEKYENLQTATAKPSAATDLGAIEFPVGLSAVHFIKLVLFSENGNMLSDNFYWRENVTDDLTALNEIPEVTLNGNVRRIDAGPNIALHVELKNDTVIPAVLAHVQLRRRTSGKRVLPVFYSDNYISLLPGESKSIQIVASKSDLAGEQPLVVVDGWNVTVKSADGITTNSEAVVNNLPVLQGKVQQRKTIKINCGGGPAGEFFTFGTSQSADGFSEDRDYVRGNTKTVEDQIKRQPGDPMPEGMYQSERWGPCAYTIPEEEGKKYDVRLYFAETTFKSVGARKFNVDINGNRVLTDYDVFAAARGEDIGVSVDTKDVQPDSSGSVVIELSNGSADQAKISGITVTAED
jgi:hypothetical protein